MNFSTDCVVLYRIVHSLHKTVFNFKHIKDKKVLFINLLLYTMPMYSLYL